MPLARPLGYYLVSRVVVVLAVLCSEWLEPSIKGVHALATDWDGGWYVHIAQYGYPGAVYNQGPYLGAGSSWAFFPALPEAIRGVSKVTTLSYVDASVLLAFVFGLTSVVGIWLAVRDVFSSDVADRSVLLYVFFPSAFVLSMGYTEGLFVTCAAFCLYALRRRMWITGSLFAAIGSLTRAPGILLVIAVGVAAMPALAQKHGRFRLLAGIVIAPLGILGWLLFSWRIAGDPFAFLKAEKLWLGFHFVWFTGPFESIGPLFTSTQAWRSGTDVVVGLGLIFIVVGIITLVWARKDGVRIPATWWVFVVGSILMASTVTETYTYSLLRYSFVVFPLFAAIAWRLRSKWTGAVAASFGFVQGALMVVVLVGFVYIAQGHGAPLVP